MPSVGGRVAALAAVVALAAGVLSGCVGQDPKPTPKPKPSSTPLYSSDAKALAAAKEAYGRYVDATNVVAQGGWLDLTPLEKVETGDALASDTKSGNANRAQGLKIIGNIAGTVQSVQRVDSTSVTTYACLDVSATKVIDAQGTDKTSPQRSNVYPLEVRMVMLDERLVVGRSDPWSGTSFC